MSPPQKQKWSLVVIGICLALIVVFISRRPKSVEQQIMAAEQMHFLGEDLPLDGGSRAFFFYLPDKYYLMLLVRHRRAVDEGGNPDFQEIVIQGYRGPLTDVVVGSAMEKKLITLLRAAIIEINVPRRYPEPAKPERLKWIIDRMEDRKSKW